MMWSRRSKIMYVYICILNVEVTEKFITLYIWNIVKFEKSDKYGTTIFENKMCGINRERRRKRDY